LKTGFLIDADAHKRPDIGRDENGITARTMLSWKTLVRTASAKTM